MTDRQLLEAAAKAAGKCLHPADQLLKSYGNWGCDTTCAVCKEDPADARWNPLQSDGDALRLAVKLRIDFKCRNEATWWDVEVSPGHVQWMHEPWNGDPYAATRRAIVRAAAEIGKGMRPFPSAKEMREEWT